MSQRASADGGVFDEVERALPGKRCLVVVGLPGTGKSFLVRDMARMAAASGRSVHLLQWDVARLAWERPDILERFPEIDGVTHAAIRGALGIWVRTTVAAWFRRHSAGNDLLLVEAPIIGGRFADLAKRIDDGLEARLAGLETSFVVVAPSRQLQRRLRQRRARQAGAEQHELERYDASMAVLDLQLAAVERAATLLGIASKSSGYDPALYIGVMQAVLEHRHVLIVRPKSLIDTRGSVYEFGHTVARIEATPEEVADTLRAAERNLEELCKEIDFGWVHV